MTTTSIKAVTKREKTISFLMDHFKAEKEIFNNYIILNYSNSILYIVAVFSPKGHKPLYHFSFKTEKESKDYIITKKSEITTKMEQEKKRQLEYDKEKEVFQQGKILISSWGCEQTNIDFYLILDRKNDFVTLQEIGEKREFTNDGDRGTTTADTTVLKGKPFKKKISKFASIKLESYKYCRLWNEKPAYWSSYA